MLALIPAAAQNSAPILLVTNFEESCPDAVLMAVHEELSAIMNPLGYRFEWCPAKRAYGTVFRQKPVFVSFKGSCRVDPRIYVRPDSAPIGLTHITNGELLPNIDLHCGRAQRLLQSALGDSSNWNQMMGRALARVLAHELYHVFTSSTRHGAGGLARDAQSAFELTRPVFRFGKKEEKLLRNHAAVIAARYAVTGEPESQTLQVGAGVTVYARDAIGIPAAIRLPAMEVASAAFASAGIELNWVQGTLPLEASGDRIGELLAVVFDGDAPANEGPDVLALTTLGRRARPEVRVFYQRVAGLAANPWRRLQTPKVLGNVLAHELTHALVGAAWYSRQGLMKKVWSNSDLIKMADGPLAYTEMDIQLLRARLRDDTGQAALARK